MSEQNPQSDSPQQHPSGCLTRMCWMVAGNAALLIAALFVAKSRQTLFSYADIALWLIVAGLLIVRYADIKWLEGRTADGREAASMRHWMRYAILLIAISFGLWLLAHLWARFGA